MAKTEEINNAECLVRTRRNLSPSLFIANVEKMVVTLKNYLSFSYKVKYIFNIWLRNLFHLVFTQGK